MCGANVLFSWNLFNMRLGIMQPYFFPYIGYFSLIKQVDKFILFDTVQFIRHGWIERNRILKPLEGWQYFQVPLQKHSRDIRIKDTLIDNQLDWKRKIFAQLQHYKKMSPYFSSVMEILDNTFGQEYSEIASLNKAALQTVCEYLNIETPIETFSVMNLSIDPANAPDEWALNICKAMVGVDEYWNPPGGITFFDRSKYEANKICLKFQQVHSVEYDQKRATFESNLSIIDVMMFNSKEEINEMLDSYELL